MEGSLSAYQIGRRGFFCSDRFSVSASILLPSASSANGGPLLGRLFIAAQSAVALLPAMSGNRGRWRYNSLTSGLLRLKNLGCTENADTAQKTSSKCSSFPAEGRLESHLNG
jgi:hypothetical protein